MQPHLPARSSLSDLLVVAPGRANSSLVNVKLLVMLMRALPPPPRQLGIPFSDQFPLRSLSVVKVTQSKTKQPLWVNLLESHQE